MRMDLNIPNHSGTCKHCHPDGSFCGAVLDPKGRHARACRVQGWRVRKHDRIREVLAVWCEKQGCNVIQERILPTAKPDADLSRMDLIIRSPKPLTPIYVDVTIADATSTEALSKNAANRDSAAAQVLERRKIEKYPNVKVTPFCVESHGRLGDHAMQLAKTVAPTEAEERTKALAELYQTISTELQWVNAEAIISATRTTT